MVDILAYIVKIVVFASCTDALLAVGSTHQTTHVCVGVHGALEDGLKLQTNTRFNINSIKV